MFSEADAYLEISSKSDYKSQLQSYIQAQYKTQPVYQTVAESGPAHRKLFKVEVQFDEHGIGHGEGRSKKAAEKMAVAMLLPMILFIFPAVFVVVAGPAGIVLVKLMSTP